MFSFLIIFGFSTWWDFNGTEFPTKLANSFNHPIFVLCYSPYCPHCVGLPQGLLNYNNSILGQRTDIDITMIDCYNLARVCYDFHIHGTPYITLILGDNYRYWPSTSERAGPGWDRFINEHIGPNLRQIN